MKHIICRLFGHTPGLFHKIRLVGYDVTGKLHATLHAKCSRCGERYQSGNVHIPTDMVAAIQKQPRNQE